ncbi:hypothetical protein F2P81_005201 [Scophthalmus maximus]|uniref:Uncharacterized protein n=1 Tax=Scophthalmus maximus TaxID=52904 RepID=A0A6A4TA03_SCOMX|nr:hypothetical protein F2P81_005201 [Scophthalmus maximus]
MKLLLSLTLIWTLSSTVPAVPADNRLQCNSCNPVTSECNIPLQCKGTEDLCFQATVTNGATSSPAYGCASKNLCAAASSLGTLPPNHCLFTNYNNCSPNFINYSPNNNKNNNFCTNYYNCNANNCCPYPTTAATTNSYCCHDNHSCNNRQ